MRDARPGWAASLFIQVVPFALLCAVAWPGVRTIVLLLAAVMILAVALFVLAPWFEAARSWDRAMAVACYASTPVLLSWFLLLFPPFAVLPIVALIHCFALCYLGVQQILECRESEAAIFVAAAWVLSGIGGMLLGGLCSAAGLI